jgi:oligopeptide transport system substrate-binding protein
VSVRALAFIALAGCSLPDGTYFGRVADHPDPTHFTWCNAGEPEYLDPVMASSTSDMKVIYEIFDGLTTFDPNGLPAPSIATSWEISRDQKTFTFHLRPDARWSNGRALTSEDFAYSLARVLHPLTASTNATTITRLEHGEDYNAGTARLVLRDSADGTFKKGDVVVATEKSLDPDVRHARGEVTLRASADPTAAVWATVPSGSEVTIVDVGGPGCPGTIGARDVAACDWAYVDFAEDDGVFGWTPLASLDAPAEGATIDLAGGGGGKIAARDVLMVPDLLGIRTPDPQTLVLITKGPVPYMLDLTVQRAMRPVPREVVSRWPRRWTQPSHIVTSGPFDLVEWSERDKLELVKSKTFWGRDSIRLERVTILSLNDQSASSNVYYQGGCDALVANNIPNTYLPIVAKRKDYLRSPFLGIYFYLVNTKKLTDVHLRRALAFALDRSQLPLILKGGQIPTAAFVPGKPIASLTDDELALCQVPRDQKGVALIVETGKVCYVPPEGEDFDLAQAKAELALARQDLGDKFPSSIEVKFNTGAEAHKTIAEWIQGQWEEHLGLHVELASQEWKTFLDATVRLDYDVARFGSIGNFPDPESEFLTQFRCKDPDNRTGWCNPRFDDLFRQAEAEPDRAARLALVHQADELMIAEAPIIPLTIYTQHLLIKPYVRGLAVNMTDHPSLRDVWIDPDWRSH